MAQHEAIDCWITLGSTYSYLTVMRLPEITNRSGVSVRFRPFHLGMLFKEMGYFPFPANSPKTAYMWQDLQRRADLYEIPIRLPAPYPAKQPFVANRVAILGLREGWGEEFIRTSYRRWFQEGQEPGDDPNLTEGLMEIGQDPQRVMSLANGEDIERALISETNEARSLGVFGSPTFVVGDQIFWGDDRLEDAVNWKLFGHVRRDP
jgi:2-hydroxychromene-2-carboxylate isomerase